MKINERIKWAPKDNMADIEKEVISQALEWYEYNMTLTALSLGIGRATLYRKLNLYNINLRRFRRES